MPIVYGLGNKGADLLTLHFAIDRKHIDWTAKNRETGTRYLEHALMIARFRMSLQLSIAALPDLSLERWESEGFLSTNITVGRDHFPIKPDGFFVLMNTERELRYTFLVEADRSTMTRARLEKKFEGYSHFWKNDVREQGYTLDDHTFKAFRVLTLTISEARATHLHALARSVHRQQQTGPLFWFACEARYTTDPAQLFQPIWQTGRDAEYRALV